MVKYISAVALLHFTVIAGSVLAVSLHHTLAADPLPDVSVPVAAAASPSAVPRPSDTPLAPTPSADAAPVIMDAPGDTPAPVPDMSGRCIVAVNGRLYDVTEFRTVHQGGDIFQCGTDMTVIFHSHHTDDTLKLMEQYAVP